MAKILDPIELNIGSQTIRMVHCGDTDRLVNVAGDWVVLEKAGTAAGTLYSYLMERWEIDLAKTYIMGQATQNKFYDISVT